MISGMMDRYDADLAPLSLVLSTMVRLASRTRQSLEQEMGLSSGYLSKLLGGQVELRPRHILMICGAVGIHPSDFYRMVYPPPGPGEGTTALRLLEETQAALGQHPPAVSSTLPADFDEQVKLSLARLLGLIPREPSEASG